MKFAYLTSLILLNYFILSTGLALFANNSAFLVAGILYCTILVAITLLIDRKRRIDFLKITSLFLLFYSIITTFSHFVIIDHPFVDYYVNIDATGFLKDAIALSKFTYAGVWDAAFTSFEYSGSPLFYAWIGTLQKLIGSSPFYNLLFQKLNVAFIGSFVPGVVYLLCSKIACNKRAFNAAIVYGIFSFTFFYSVGFMRDIHIALIYAIGLYIISGNNYSARNYVLLFILGLTAYFIRLENGIFFLAFLGVWMFNSSSEKKLIIGLGSLLAAIVVVFVIGGLDTVYNMALSTIQAYSERAVEKADSGSFGVALRNLPIPLNYVGVTAFGQISPFPFWFVFRNDISFYKNLFYLPEAVAGLFWFTVWVRLMRYPKRLILFYQKYKSIVFITLIYLIAVSMAQPGPRRLMAVYPAIYMGYTYTSNSLFKSQEIIYNVLLYIFLLTIYFLLKI